MRNRNIRKNYYLSESENEKLKKRVSTLGLSESEYIRGLIKGHVPKGKPSKELTDLIYELNKIGNNINQIARVSNAMGNVDTESLNVYKEKLDKVIYEIKKKYLGYDIYKE